MRKITLLALCMLFGCVSLVSAQIDDPIQIPIENPYPGSGNGHKTLDELPTVYYADYVLTFDSSCIGCTIELVQDDEVVFTGVVNANGEVEIPDTLVGLIELRIYRGDDTYIGEFEP